MSFTLLGKYKSQNVYLYQKNGKDYFHRDDIATFAHEYIPMSEFATLQQVETVSKRKTLSYETQDRIRHFIQWWLEKRKALKEGLLIIDDDDEEEE